MEWMLLIYIQPTMLIVVIQWLVLNFVWQQLDSFDEFIQNTMQELVDDSADIRVSPELQHLVGYDEEMAEEE